MDVVEILGEQLTARQCQLSLMNNALKEASVLIPEVPSITSYK